MPRTATEKATKAATKRANTKSKVDKDGNPKEKRAPSAYNVFMGENMKKYREEHPGILVKEAMVAVAAMWRESPQNPKNGKVAGTKTQKVAAEDKAPKSAKSATKPKPKQKITIDKNDEEEKENVAFEESAEESD